ncbi:MAG: NAD(+)/NADH kinase [Ignavibacteria bacterium]|nr:NAD(+)/NADH kinase [Ignavibacteria bacterium]
MTIGIVGNTSKDRIGIVITEIIKKIDSHGINYFLAEALSDFIDNKTLIPQNKFLSIKNLAEISDILFSVGGDGTMLSTSLIAHENDTPVLGINFGKLGFLTEVDISAVNDCLISLKNNQFSIEERMILEGFCKHETSFPLFAVNDIVIDKGGWAKMIEVAVTVGGQYVTTFSADGLIIATPTGSTGYSLSVGGPIVSPRTNVITLSPISAHSLNLRPLVLPGDDEIKVSVESQHNKIQIHSDGQRTIEIVPPVEISIAKSKHPLKLIKTESISYFEILRNKLMWGLDVRKFSEKS